MNHSIYADMQYLWRRSKGSPEICIAVLDGTADLSHPSLTGANLQRMDSLVPDAPETGAMSNHATHIVSTLFGQHRDDSEVRGWAPHCRGLVIPVFSNKGRSHVSQLDLARAINQAIASGANVINISGGEFVKDKNEADLMLRKAVESCRENNVLIVAAAGNDGCECLHIPAALPSVLAVGAMDDKGYPLDFSNWGKAYSSQGILAPGQDILGAQAAGGTARLSGTSFATPLVSAVAALLLSIQRERGISPSPTKVREALLESASPCNSQWGSDCRRFLAGSLNIQGAYALLFNGENLMNDENVNLETSDQPVAASDVSAMSTANAGGVAPSGLQTEMPVQPASLAASGGPDGGITPSAACACKTQSKSTVYALGKIGYDFGTEARRDGFTQLMQSSANNYPNPYNPEQLLDYLNDRPYESSMLIWTLNIDLTPIYAIEPQEPFASDTYALLIGALQGQILNEDKPSYIERVSIPGYLTGKSVRLYSGQVVPVISAQPRGLYYWNVNRLIDAAMNSFPDDNKVSGDREITMRTSLREFLNRIYYDYRNLGTTSSERALNFAATNAFQAVAAFTEALFDKKNQTSRQLANIAVEKSPFCRLDSDCWDVKLGFFDPDNARRAMKIVRYTIDVSDVMPVTLGEPKIWSAPTF